MIDVLVLTAYVTSTLVAYRRTRRRFPAWQLRAELAALTVGLIVMGLVAYAATVHLGLGPWRLETGEMFTVWPYRPVAPVPAG